MSSNTPEIRKVSTAEFTALWKRGERPRLIDVRTPVEFAEVHAEMAQPLPLSDLNEAAVAANKLAEGDLYIICKSGARAAKAAAVLQGMGLERVAVIEGGTDAWVAAGGPVARDRKVLPLQRQVHIVFGLINIVFAVLALAVDPLFAVGNLVMSLGITNAGVTGWCGLGLLIAKAPWNRSCGAGLTT